MWMLSAQNAASEPFATLRTLPGSDVFWSEDGQVVLLNDAQSRAERFSGEIPLKLLFAGGVTAARGGPFLFLVGLWTPLVDRDELLSWYEGEHLPMLLECPAWGGCRFVEAPAKEGCQFYALHQLFDKSALESDARRASRETSWFNKLKRHDWFDQAFTRQLYVRRGDTL